MKTTHTPGPWVTNQGSVIAKNALKVYSIEICDPSAGVNGIGKLLPIDEREANAALIAAAPDLLAALEWAEAMILQHCKNEDGQTPDVEPIRAAIAKARG